MFRKFLCILFALITALQPLSAFAAEPSHTIVVTDKYFFDALSDQLEESFEIQSGSYTDGASGQVCYYMDIPANELSGVTSLSFRNKYVSDISGLEVFGELAELDLANNMISDISPISGLSKLSALDVSGNGISDISPILGLARLKRLDLAKTGLSDKAESSENSIASRLSSLTKLTELDLSHNSLRYTEGLEKLKNLKKLELYSNYIHELSGLSGLSELEFLNLGENNESGNYTISGLSALEDLENLKWLDFSQNNTADIVKYIENLENLEYLCLNQNKISDAAGLSKLKRLRELELYNNLIASIEPFLGLDRLEYLSVQQNKITSLKGIFEKYEESDGEDALVWKNMKKLDTAQNWSGSDMWRSKELKALRRLFLAGSLEWRHNYNMVYDPEAEGLPHIDAESGARYVTYEDFGARCDGVSDDYSAMYNAHAFANSYAKAHPEYEVELRGIPGKTYHYFNDFSPAVNINTSVDWQGATIAIHDEKIGRRYGRTAATRVFRLSNVDSGDVVTIEKPSWTIGRDTKSLADKAEVMNAIAALQAKAAEAYDEFFCIAKNEGLRQFVRFGSNANSGEPQQDRFKIDAGGKLLNDVIWDFDALTSLEIFPVSKKAFTVQNANIVTYGAEDGSEEAQGRSGKGIYFYRHLCFSRCTNLKISNIRHSVVPDEVGLYYGIIELNNVADAEISECSFFAHKSNNKSSYDLTINSAVNVRIKDVDSNDLMDRSRWGVTGFNYVKNLSYENCSLNHADIHQGVYGQTIKDSDIGTICLIGQGETELINTHIYDDDMIELRTDYGGTFDGRISLINCTFTYWGRYIEAMIKNLLVYNGTNMASHDFGYELHFPDVYVENLTIDSQYAPPGRNYMVLITNWAGEGAADMPKEYWPKSFVVNGYRLVNTENLTPLSEGDMPPLRFTASNEGDMGEVNFVITDCRLRLCDGKDTDITTRVFKDESPVLSCPLILELNENDSAENTLRIYRDGGLLSGAEKLSGSLKRTFSEPGSYSITIDSHQQLKYWVSGTGWQYYDRDGSKTLNFTILSEDAPLSARLFSAGGEKLDEIPDGAFEAEVLLSGAALEEGKAAELVFAGYDKNGRLSELYERELSPGSETYTERFEVENGAGAIKSARVLLFSKEGKPLSQDIKI